MTENNNLNDHEKLLTVHDAAELLNIKVSRIRSAIFKGEIPYIKIGRLIRFDRDDIFKWLKGLKDKTQEIIEEKENSSWLPW